MRARTIADAVMKGKAARAGVLYAGHRRHQLNTAQRLQDCTFPRRRDHVMLWAVIGQIKFYDETTAWGVIQGADGGLYAMRGDQLAGPRPEVGDRVVFEVQSASGGPRAIAIRRTRGD